MLISVIIPMFNEAQHIGRTLEGLKRAASLYTGQTELIVVDNGSDDASVSIAQQLGAQVMVHPGIRVGALRNRGAAAAQGEIVAFVDADIEVAENWFAVVEETFRDPTISGVGMVHLTPPQAPWFARVWADRLMGKRANACDIDALDTSNLAVRKALFESLGGFNENLGSGEDRV
jgi:glycosyltransferase involved in cell wall biosynthesis